MNLKHFNSTKNQPIALLFSYCFFSVVWGQANLLTGSKSRMCASGWPNYPKLILELELFMVSLLRDMKKYILLCDVKHIQFL